MKTKRKRVPIVSIVGQSNSGKTSLVCALVIRLAQTGYSVAVAKHAPHGHDLGDEGTDSRRIADAGADKVSVVSPDATTRFESTKGGVEESIESLQKWAVGCDLLLLEGWKSSGIPKILVGDPGDLAISPPVVATVQAGPPFDQQQILELLRKIEDQMSETPDRLPDIAVRIDGDELRLKRFPAAALSAVITGYLATLEDVTPEWNKVQIEINRR